MRITDKNLMEKIKESRAIHLPGHERRIALEAAIRLFLQRKVKEIAELLPGKWVVEKEKNQYEINLWTSIYRPKDRVELFFKSDRQTLPKFSIHPGVKDLKHAQLLSFECTEVNITCTRPVKTIAKSIQTRILEDLEPIVILKIDEERTAFRNIAKAAAVADDLENVRGLKVKRDDKYFIFTHHTRKRFVEGEFYAARKIEIDMKVHNVTPDQCRRILEVLKKR